MNNSDVEEDESCQTHYFSGSVAILIFVLGSALSLSLQVSLYRKSDLSKKNNLFLLSLLILNFMNGIVDMSLLITRFFSCK